MQVSALKVVDAAVVTPTVHGDDRGDFLEWFAAERWARQLGRRLPVRQANASVSRRGVLRGIHFADVPPSQAKLVTCFAGTVLDVVVDLREGSPTFGAWDAVRLDPVDRRVVLVPEGCGHAFLALEDGSTVAYLLSEPHAPAREHAVHPLDPQLGIDWPLADLPEGPVLSPKDAAAPTLAEASAQGALPSYADCRALYASLGATTGSA